MKANYHMDGDIRVSVSVLYTGIWEIEYLASGSLVCFNDPRDAPRVFKVQLFRWNIEEVGASLKAHISDASRFAEQLNALLQSRTSGDDTPVPIPTTPQHTSSSHTPRSSHASPASVYEFREASAASPTLRTPVRPGKRQCIAEEPPVLFKKRDQQTLLSKEQKIIKEVKEAYLGTSKILTAHLELGFQLRDVRQPFVEELMEEMRAFPGHLYQPLCVIVNTLDSPEQFREADANGYHYKVIGGCHNFSAAKKLQSEMPGEEVFRFRNCSIYADVMSQEAITWLANRHNIIGECRRPTTLLEKIKITKGLLVNSSTDGDRKDRVDSAMLVLGKLHTKRQVQLICSLAEMGDEAYRLLIDMLSLHTNGKLKGQRLSPTEITQGPDMKPYVLSDLPALPIDAQVRLLQSVIQREMTIPEYQKEAKDISRLLSVQHYFLDLMGLKRWEDAERIYPQETTREALEHFTEYSLSKCPEQLKAFCRSAKRRLGGASEVLFTGRMGASGSFIHMDASSVTEEAVTEAVPDFLGADLVILDMPEDWTSATLKQFLNFVTSLNINYQLESFSVVVFCGPSKLGMVMKSFDDTRHFEDPMEGFYMVPKKQQAPRLINSVFGMVLARKKVLNHAHRPIVWSSGTSVNYLEATHEGLFHHNGAPVDGSQRPIKLHRELIQALTTPGQFVMDVCCGTGTGTIAALLEGRNAIAIDKDADMKAFIDIRLHQSMDDSQPDGQALDEEESSMEEEEDEEEDAEEEAEEEAVEQETQDRQEEETMMPEETISSL